MRQYITSTRLPFALAITLTACITGCNNANQTTPQQATGGNMPPPPVVEFITATYEAVPQTQSLSGRTSAYQKAEVKPQVSGIIEKRLFIEGSYVQKGQPLYKIDTSNYTNAVSTQQAALAKAKANLNLLKLTLQRYQGLLSSNAVSQQEYDNIKAQVDLAKADVAAAKAQLDASQLNLNRTLVRAPISGKTELSTVDVGALVNANQAQPLTSISQLDPIYVDISQSSADMLKLQHMLNSGSLEENQKQASIKLTLEDGSQYAQTGHLSFSQAQVDPNTGSVTLRAIFDNDQRILLPGMYVTASIQQGLLKNAMLLPQSAIMRTPDGKSQVYVIDAENKIKPTPITLNGTYQSNWIVTEGLQNGAKVVVVGGMKVKPEMTVTPKPATTQPVTDNGTGNNAANHNTTASTTQHSTQASVNVSQAEQ